LNILNSHLGIHEESWSKNSRLFGYFCKTHTSRSYNLCMAQGLRRLRLQYYGTHTYSSQNQIHSHMHRRCRKDMMPLTHRLPDLHLTTYHRRKFDDSCVCSSPDHCTKAGRMIALAWFCLTPRDLKDSRSVHNVGV
jgi:hypothetical protein